jgi:hypothetical protein
MKIITIRHPILLKKSVFADNNIWGSKKGLGDEKRP